MASMFSSTEISKTASTLLSSYAWFAGSMMLIRSVANVLIPQQLRSYLFSKFRYFFDLSPNLTLNIDEKCGICKNKVYEAAEVYLCTLISPRTERLKVSRIRKQKHFTITLENGETVVDRFKDVQLTWRFVCIEGQNSPPSGEKRRFELSFKKKHKDEVLEFYLPDVSRKAKEIKKRDKVIRLYSRQCPIAEYEDGKRGSWGSIILEHPATFETLAMDRDLKKMIEDDLDMFLSRKNYYKKVGKAWKRGYLLYGPPGTGKSSLVAAMANRLKFDIYDLGLTSVRSDTELRRRLLSTTKQSILLIEDIDCSSEVLERQTGNKSEQQPAKAGQLTLSGILNCIDGIWSSCGDERIIVFTTNHKDKLDPALLRPGRMDMHIHMSYCTPYGFRILASNYHGIQDHELFGEIDEAIRTTEVTPAEVAEQLLRSKDVGTVIQNLIEFVEVKKIENQEAKALESSRITNEN